MHVVHLLHHLTLGGIEVMLTHAIPHLQEKGITLSFCCTGGERELDERVRALGCEVQRIRKKRSPFAAARELQRFLDGQQFDLVHSHFGYSSGGFALGASRAGVPFVNSIHASAPTALESWDDHFLLRMVKAAWLSVHGRLMDRHVALHVGHSESNLDNFFGKWRENSRYRVVYNGVMMDARERAATERPTILHVGNFRPAKNHRALLDLFDEILRHEPEARLICVGDGPLRPAIEKEALLRQLPIDFIGQQRDPFVHYAKADLLLFPSKSEGFANVLVEAQAAGLPVAASDLPAHRESVAPSQHHALFPLEAPKLAAEIAVEQLRSGRGSSEAAEHVRAHFSIERFAEELAALYREFSASDPSPRG